MIIKEATERANQSRVFPPLLDETTWSAFVREYQLTPRESEVMLMITSGYTYTAICEHLHVRRPTLRTHLRAAYRKVGCASRVELILYLFHEWSGCGGRVRRGKK